MQYKKLFIFLIILLFICITSCNKSKDKKDVPNPGGWIQNDINSITVLKAYTFLKKEIVKKHPKIQIIKLISSQSQVVAGMNYKMTCQYQKGTESKTQNLIAKIYQDLKGAYSLIQVNLNEKKL